MRGGGELVDWAEVQAKRAIRTSALSPSPWHVKDEPTGRHSEMGSSQKQQLRLPLLLGSNLDLDLD